MYAQNQPINSNRVPPVRPRSSLSKTEHQRITGRVRSRKSSNVTITLAGFCIFLFLLCGFLLGALVFVGKTLAERADFQFIQHNNATNYTKTKALLFRLLTIVRGLEGSDAGITLNTYNNDNNPNHQITKTILHFPSSTSTTKIPDDSVLLYRASVNSLPAHIMNTSKVLQQITYRLPRELRPQHYKLRLQPNLVEKSYTGNVTIRLEVLKPIAFIPVHAKTLNISTERVVQLNEGNSELSEILPVRCFMHPEYEYWITEFDQPLTIGNYSLTLKFNGSLANRIAGFYQSSYLDKKRNEQRWIATSKFEPTYARTAFPCFDEPAMKAIFSVTLLRPTGDGYHALSNLNIESEKVLGDVTEVHFADTVPMSTYLACFIVSDFAHKAAEVRAILPNTKPIEMRVFSTAAQVNKVTYALETGVRITEFYIEYFGIPYPLPKLDMAAIPDFVSGAMEHWGLVTYRETALLYDPTISSSSNKQRVATVIAHELAHMWFGNLVTMKWWNDLWLNEGFASYIEYKGVNHVHPEWQMLDQFLIMDLHQVMSLDATLAAHPIVQSVENPSQITELFDSITYSKGASIVRMLEDLVGSEKFRNATRNYLIKYRYGNAETDDFLTEIEALNFDFDVKQIMQTWTTQMGLPVVEVTKESELSYKLKQKRFLSNSEDYNTTYTDSQFNYHWSIPITYYTSENAEVQRTIFNYNDNEITINVGANVKWLKINKNQVGYYRVNYPVETWRALIQALKETPQAFSVADRAHLINDVFALADATQLNYSIALDLTTYLANERDYVAWSVANSRLNAIKNLLHSTDVYSDFVAYVRQLLNNVYATVSWDSTNDHLSNLLRSNILNAACRYGNEEALQQAAKRFDAWLLDASNRPSPDIRSTIYYYGMQVSGNEKKWQQVWDLYVAEQDAQEKLKLMDSLAAIKETWLLERYINLAWDENLVRGQDYFTCLRYISQNPAGRSLVWDYVRENWTRLVERFGINERYLGRLIPGITSRFATNTKLAEMETFFALHPNAGAGTAARKEALETVKYNIKWLQHNKAYVTDWLAGGRQIVTQTTTTTTTSTTTPSTTTMGIPISTTTTTTTAASTTENIAVGSTTNATTTEESTQTTIEPIVDVEGNPSRNDTATEGNTGVK